MVRPLICCAAVSLAVVVGCGHPKPLSPQAVQRRAAANRHIATGRQAATNRRRPRADIGPPPWIRSAPPLARRHTAYDRDLLPRNRKVSRRWTNIVIHHSATSKGGAKAFDKFHRRKGWDELGYHFVIGNGSDTADGVIEVGSRWHKQKHGAHCKTPDNYYNDHGIGICLVGDFSRSRPSARQMASLQRLVRFLGRECRIPPSRVTTHREITHKTACPGRYFPLSAVRRALAATFDTPRKRQGDTALVSLANVPAERIGPHACSPGEPCRHGHSGL